MSNKALQRAKRLKNDEFYTQLSDIEQELQHYQHFRDKVVYCNCDDYRKSQFVRYFLRNFKKLGLKKLLASCIEGYYAVYEGPVEGSWDPVPADCLVFRGDGDFRSPESLEFLKQADIVVTNPPFSLFREYVAQLVEHDKKFLILGNMNAVKYKGIFPLIHDNRLWLGVSNRSMPFDTPDGTQEKVNISWFTNLSHNKRNEELILYRRYTPKEYPTYDNYDAINVDKVADIPEDYAGVIGVPITYLDKHNPDQFEIVGITQPWFDARTKHYPRQIQVSSNGNRSEVTHLNNAAAIKVPFGPKGKTHYFVGDACYVTVFTRLLIRNKHNPKFKLLGYLHNPFLNGRKLYKRLLIQRT